MATSREALPLLLLLLLAMANVSMESGSPVVKVDLSVA
jgi:hypothetical protein